MPDLTPELLLHGYAIGIFPMAEHRDDTEIFWVDPERRGVLPLDGFHMSRSLAKAMRRSTFEVAINRDFDAVVAACADRADTWINAEISSLYSALHLRGHAHSLEIRDAGSLVGGVYGVTLGTAFFGESMFSRRSNASKMALAALIDRLNRAGFTLFDTQFLTTHLASLGAQEITRKAYHTLLEHAQTRTADFTGPEPLTLYEVMQRMTQTS
ncbi:Leucyl/phenylalanyl-tRNA--protein transferase [Sulfitobacter noctilucae]|uniref:leucyl/phenylalanyl-tRNA--protein transferase n=1 Tax=Sulfitobacter noctilucae TaxID=1342302 RepID=UPI0004682A48|nr:leucyl/phenylalanyl-tRNA--protein transferase [Sulfitobacter noctilucae]KIN60708.1 Leucyl/phenylalanyl-tRNA--protein transferase [Sulfitobacter noctilucae]